MSKKKPKSARTPRIIDSDIRITPAWILDLVRDFGDGVIKLDVCTQPDNPTGAADFYSLADGCNGLIQRWKQDAGRGVIWGNYPYSRGSVIEWGMKSTAEALLGAEIIGMTKDDCRTSWNKYLRENTDARCRIARGVGFLEPDGNGGYRKLIGPMWGSCLWYWGPRRRRFERIFSRIGEVIHGLGPQEVAA